MCLRMLEAHAAECATAPTMVCYSHAAVTVWGCVRASWLPKIEGWEWLGLHHWPALHLPLDSRSLARTRRKGGSGKCAILCSVGTAHLCIVDLVAFPHGWQHACVGIWRPLDISRHWQHGGDLARLDEGTAILACSAAIIQTHEG